MASQPPKNLLRFLGLSVSGDLGELTLATIRGNRLQAYAKAPPKDPPTAIQVMFRQWFKSTSEAWNLMTREQRTWWQNVALYSGGNITGPSLWIWWSRKQDTATLQTLARQANESFPPP